MRHKFPGNTTDISAARVTQLFLELGELSPSLGPLPILILIFLLITPY